MYASHPTRADIMQYAALQSMGLPLARVGQVGPEILKYPATKVSNVLRSITFSNLLQNQSMTFFS